MSSVKARFLSKYPAMGSASFRRYWFGSLFSVGATQLINLGFGWLVFDLSRSALYLGFLGAAIALPNIGLSMFGGVIADQFNKQKILLTIPPRPEKKCVDSRFVLVYNDQPKLDQRDN